MSELKKKVDLSTYAIQQNTQDSILKMQKEMNLELAASQIKSQELQSTNLELKSQLAATTEMLREFETNVKQQHAEIMQKLNHLSS